MPDVEELIPAELKGCWKQVEQATTPAEEQEALLSTLEQCDMLITMASHYQCLAIERLRTLLKPKDACSG
jgi:hypothetical protein